VSTWDESPTKATDGSLKIEVDLDNTYVLQGWPKTSAGPDTVDPVQLDLAVELLTDAGDGPGTRASGRRCPSSESLGWLVSFVLRPDPTRLAASPTVRRRVGSWQACPSIRDRLRPIEVVRLQDHRTSMGPIGCATGY